MKDPALFTTIYGRNLIGELKNFVHRPYLVVTMADLWPKFRDDFDGHLSEVYLVHSMDAETLEEDLKKLKPANCIIGLGGGQALDAAKYFAWRARLPLFQVPTSMSVNAVFGQRSGVREGGNVRYMGWTVPEAVYIDFDVVRGAPPLVNRSGIGDIFCYHTGHADWGYARDRGKTEAKWPYDAGLVAEARAVLDTVMAHVDDISAVNDTGIRVLMDAHRWGGAAFHNAGWNPRHIEGIDHFVFYALEYYTGRKFIHGQPVCLGVYVGALLHEDRPAEMLEAMHRVGVDIRPEAMKLSWDEVRDSLKKLSGYVRQAGLWYGIAHDAKIDDKFVDRLRGNIESVYGAWKS